MVITGLDVIKRELPRKLKGKKIGIVCHAPSVTNSFEHIIDVIHSSKECELAAIFGPQHGLWGETQDNMIEWEGNFNKHYNVNIFSLYGETRKPTVEMLSDVDILLIDLQDIGARPYTYIWTMKLCMEAAGSAKIPVWVLDRPNPISAILIDGPVLKKEFYTFVGMASIPLCHRMTIGEIAIWLKEVENVSCDLNLVKMERWSRNMLFSDTGLPWVAPSPNMPTLSTASVYPGMVLTEATNLSEARGTTLPFELFGAPWLNTKDLISYFSGMDIKGCTLRPHNYIPTFHKYIDEFCNGIQVHITDIAEFRPVYTTLAIYEAIINTTDDKFNFLNPPYEYENNLIPFDILSGDSGSRKCLESGGNLKHELEKWQDEKNMFESIFNTIKIY
jgi:uncharacterized protein YbbC (DUF1343 family)